MSDIFGLGLPEEDNGRMLELYLSSLTSCGGQSLHHPLGGARVPLTLQLIG